MAPPPSPPSSQQAQQLLLGAANSNGDFDVSRYERVERTEAHILIVGGGLGGLALALGLQERGIKAQLFERHPGLRSDTATAIGIGPNGVTALEGIRPGLSKVMADLGTYSTDLRIDIVRGGKEASTRIHKYPEGVYVSVCWKLVQQSLASFVDQDMIHCSHKLLFYKKSVGGVEAYFEVGNEKTGCSSHLKIVFTKLLIGADGIWSAIRKQMVGDEPRYLNMVDWNAVVYNPNQELIKGVERGELYLRFEENAETRFLLCNAGDYTLWILRKLDEAGDLANSILKNQGGLGNPGSKARALQQLEGHEGWDQLKTAIEATNEEIIFERKIMDRLPLDKWSDADGHVLLIGDAAHAQYVGPGQGARTAFEDAHQLSMFLEEARDSCFSEESIKVAVKKFEEVRVPRMKKMQEYAAQDTQLPMFQPEWVQKLTPEETRQRSFEYMKWVEAYPKNQQGDPDSTYFM